MAITKAFREGEPYAGRFARFDAPTEPILDPVETLFRAVLEVYQIREQQKHLIYEGEATCLVTLSPASPLRQLMEGEERTCPNPSERLQGKWMLLQFAGLLRSGRQHLRYAGRFDHRRYSVGNSPNVNWKRIGWFTKSAGYSAPTWHRIFDVAEAIDSRVMRRSGTRKDRQVDPDLLQRLLSDLPDYQEAAARLRRAMKASTGR